MKQKICRTTTTTALLLIFVALEAAVLQVPGWLTAILGSFFIVLFTLFAALGLLMRKATTETDRPVD